MNMNTNRERRTFILWFVVAFVFVVFTGPYAVVILNTNRNPMWTTALLITNSGVNSIVFFFRAHYQQLICCAKKNEVKNINKNCVNPSSLMKTTQQSMEMETT